MATNVDIATKLKPKQIIALNAVMDGATLAEAAKEAKVKLDTVEYWVYSCEPFREVYDEQRRQLLNEVGYRMPFALARAVDLLSEIFTKGEKKNENRRPDLALKLVQSVVSKGTNINFNMGGNSVDNSQHLTINGQVGAPLDAKQLDPGAIGGFVEALRSAASVNGMKRVGPGKE